MRDLLNTGSKVQAVQKPSWVLIFQPLTDASLWLFDSLSTLDTQATKRSRGLPLLIYPLNTDFFLCCVLQTVITGKQSSWFLLSTPSAFLSLSLLSSKLINSVLEILEILPFLNDQS